MFRGWGDASFKECGTFLTRTRLCELFWQRAKDEKLRRKFNECERESTRYILIKRKELKVESKKLHQKILSLGDTLPWQDPMDLFERLGERVAGYEGYSRQVQEAFGLKDLVLEVEGEAATLAAIYIVTLHYKDGMEQEAASLELLLSRYSQNFDHYETFGNL